MKWPVLAQLPWVGEPTASIAADRAPAILSVEEYEAEEARSSLRIAEPASETIDVVERRIHAAAAADRLAAEAPHLAIRHYEWPALTDASTETKPEAIVEPEPLAPRWQRRIDPANHRQPPAFTLHVPSHETLASRLFQWYATIAPAAGVVVTVSLVIAAGWLYRMKFGASTAVAPAEQAIEAPTLPVEPRRQVNVLPSNDSSAILLQPAPLLDWSLKPIIDPPPATIAPPERDVPQQVTKPKSEASPSPPAEPMQNAQAADAPSMPEQPVTPTPNLSPFPKTAYPDFDFSLLTFPASPQSATVFELPADAGTASQTPH